MKKILNERVRMQQLAGILSEMKVEGGELEMQIREFEKLHEKFTEAKKHFMSIEADFRVAEDVVRKALESIDETEERMLELEDIAVRIKAKGSTKTTFPYKLGFETLLAQVNSAIAAQIDKLMQSEMKMHEVKSTIELKRKGLEESLSVSKLMSKAGEFVTGIFAKLGDFFRNSNSKLDGYIGELKGMLKDGGEDEMENLFGGKLVDVGREKQEGEGSFMNGRLNEALNKDIKVFGQDLDKKFKEAGFDTLVLMQPATPEQLNIIKTKEKAVLFEVSQTPETQMLTLRVNPKMASKAESIINRFQLSNYDGPVLKRGWTSKQVQGAINPGDIVNQKMDHSRGEWYFYRLAKVDTKVKNITL